MSSGEAKHEVPTDSQPSADDSSAGNSKSPQTKPPVTLEGSVPKKAAEDDPRAWGDADSDADHDAWLREQKPPHWG